MISGHRRKKICEENGISEIPCIVKDISDDEANIIHYYYKYLSNIGSHPKLALKEQADFCRVM